MSFLPPSIPKQWRASHLVRGIVRHGPKPLRMPTDSASLRAELDRRLDAYEADGDPGRPATPTSSQISARS